MRFDADQLRSAMPQRWLQWSVPTVRDDTSLLTDLSCLMMNCRTLIALILGSTVLHGSPRAVVAQEQTQAEQSQAEQTQAEQSQAGQSKEIDFNQQIRPIFHQHCTACHGGVKQAGDVSFSYADQVLPPEGWIVEPGDPEASILIERVVSDDPDTQMPPPDHGKPLSEDEIQLLKLWIKQGAKWSKHWAFEKPTRSPKPSVSDSNWPTKTIDYFVLARLDQEALKPSADALPERWLRRVTLDLTGLPATLEDRRAFLSDFRQNGEAAYQRVVDRLLHSPAFGERWASVWLDQIRYADSKGLGLDGRRNIWKYRDWVIDAINRDMPFDEFTLKQIAGDLLPDPTIEDLIATAAHRVTQTNEEGGTDDEEFRIAAVLDRVNTTWQAWQGVTFGCVQCHNHPYDPFRHEEYYQFVDFFNNSSDSDLGEEYPTIRVPLNVEDYDRAGQLDNQIRATGTEIWQHEYKLLSDESLWQPLTALDVKSSNATRLQTKQFDGRGEFSTVGTVSKNTDITITADLPGGIDQLTAVRLTAMPLAPETALADSEHGFVISHIEAKLILPDQDDAKPISIQRLVCDEPHPFFDPNESLNKGSNRGFSAYSRIHYSRQAALLLEEPLDVPDGSRIEVTLRHRILLQGAFPLITRRGHLAVTNSATFAELDSDSTISKLREQQASLKQQRSSIKSTSIPVLRQRPDHLQRPTHVFIRGLFLTKDQQVTANLPSSLTPLADGQPADRLALGHWLASPANPLTARVLVNRIWARLFGVGLVSTEEDFGSSGELPSHPRLLDDLAYRFMHEFAWSRKQLIGELVLSRTYRQTAKLSKALAERDPSNRLLARGPRQRLSAEMVRDQALMLSGLMSDKRFGPPVHPPIPDGVWRPFQAGDKWNTPGTDSGDRYRRSIYTYMKRSIPYPMFASFDAPSREFCTPRRLTSNTPLQALVMLNDQTFDECADALARRIMESSDQPREQVRYGFMLCTQREPRQAELAKLVSLLAEDSDQSTLDDLTVVAKVLLNLDEVITK